MHTYTQHYTRTHPKPVHWWYHAWWDRTDLFTLLYGVLFMLAVWFVFLPMLHVSELQVRGTSLRSYEQLSADVQHVEQLVQEPVSQDAIHYFEVLDELNTTAEQCALFMETIKGAPVIDPDWPCVRFRGQQFWNTNELQMAYNSAFGMETLGRARDRYAALHPGWEERAMQGIYTTVYHPEVVLTAYLHGLLLSVPFFLARLAQKEFNVYLELCNPRFWLAVLCWPIAVFIYPGDPVRQLKDLAKAVAYLMSVTISCFAGGVVNAAGKILSKAKKDEEPALIVTGYAQGVLDGNGGRNQFREDNVRLEIEYAFHQWVWHAQFGFSPFDWEHGRTVRQAYIQYTDDTFGSLRIGRFFPAGGWTTPAPNKLPTVRYPFADPGRGEATGMQYSRQLGPVTGYVAFTGLSGSAFLTAQGFEGHEVAGRVEWQVNSGWLLAVTGQDRPDIDWGSLEFQYASPDAQLSVRGVVYGGRYAQGQGFMSGYLLGSYTWNQYVETHVMLDHGVDQKDRGTLGITLSPFGSKHLSLTTDGRYDIRTGVIEPQVRVQIAF